MFKAKQQERVYARCFPHFLFLTVSNKVCSPSLHIPFTLIFWVTLRAVCLSYPRFSNLFKLRVLLRRLKTCWGCKSGSQTPRYMLLFQDPNRASIRLKHFGRLFLKDNIFNFINEELRWYLKDHQLGNRRSTPYCISTIICLTPCVDICRSVGSTEVFKSF